jgi:hypothetical protein
VNDEQERRWMTALARVRRQCLILCVIEGLTLLAMLAILARG